jgi:hypothetical protein
VVGGQEADHFMTIVSLDGEFDYPPYQPVTSRVHLSHKSTKSAVCLGPATFSQRWRVPRSGFYTPTDVTFVVTPHISEKAGVLATVKLIDATDMSPSRVLFETKVFNLGHGITLEGSQLPFCLPIGEYPIHFEVTVSRSQFQGTRTMYTTSLEWQLMYSPTPLSRVKSVFAVAHHPVVEVTPNFSMKTKNKSSVKAGRPLKVLEQGRVDAGGGTTGGLVPPRCVGPVHTPPSKTEGESV